MNARDDEILRGFIFIYSKRVKRDIYNLENSNLT